MAEKKLEIGVIGLGKFGLRMATTLVSLGHTVVGIDMSDAQVQRAEDALDDLGEGFSLHRPGDRKGDGQTNASARMRRVIRFRGREYELDAGLMARLRLRERQE